MRVVLLLLLLLTTCTSGLVCFGQTQKPDVIVKTDNTRIQCRILGVDAAAIRYRTLNTTTTRQINKSLVNRIEYANGKIESFPKSAVNNHKPTLPPPRLSEYDQVIVDLEKGKPVQGRVIRLRPVFFDTGSNEVLPQSFAYLDSIALFLVKIPTLVVELRGYTDNTGSQPANYQLSERRAKAVRNYLIANRNIASYRVQAKGYGPTNPVATNQTDQGRAANRRVELTFLALSDQVYVIQLTNGQRIETTFVVVSTDNRTVSYRQTANAPLVRVAATDVEFIEYPDQSRRRVGSTEVLASPKSERIADQPTPPNEPFRRLSFQINALPTMMLGSQAWTLLPLNGYGHTVGVGGSVQVDYWLMRWLSAGAALGYRTWRTEVGLVENRGDVPYATRFNNASQFLALAHLRVKVVKGLYIMPQGGVNWLQVSSQQEDKGLNFSGFQTTYGGTVGYLLRLGQTVHLDVGAFWQTALGSETLKTNHSVEPMQYAGLRLGLGFSR